MKSIVLLLTGILLFSCAKKNDKVKPIEEPYVCKTGEINLEGRYTHYHFGVVDTIYISFVSNRCPKENENNYLVKNVKKAFTPLLKPNSTFKFTQNDYSMYVREDVKNGYIDNPTGQNPISLFTILKIDNAGNIIVKGGNLFNNTSNGYMFFLIK